MSSLSRRAQSLADTGLGAHPDPVFDRFAEMVCTALDTPVALVSLVDADRQFFPGEKGLAEPWAQRRQTPLSHSFCQHAVASAEPLVLPDARRDGRTRDSPAISDLGVVGYAAMPLFDGDGTALGSLCAIDHQPRHWTGRDLALLADLAAACSDSLQLRIATRHAQAGQAAAYELTRRAEAAYDRSQVLLNASVELTRTRTAQDVVTTAQQMISGGFDPANIGVLLLDAPGYLRIASTEKLPPDVVGRWRTIPVTAAVPAAESFRTGRTIMLADPAAIAAAFPAGADDLRRLGWQAIAATPIPGLRGNLGVLTLAWDQPHDIDVPERAVITALAGYIGQALERANDLNRQNTAAATLQKALLPPLPRVDPLVMTARYLPAHHEHHVGGDWYDAILLPDRRLALVIGDVAGHSLDAAAAMGELRSMLRGYLVDRAEPPSALLHRLERANRTLAGNTIATVLLGHLEPAPDGAYRLHWSNAGHPPPTVVHPDGTVAHLPGVDPLIGAFRHPPRTDHTHPVPAGATLLLHTDGLVEARGELIDEGFRQLHDLLREHHSEAPHQLANLLARHAETRAHEDDVALLIIRIPGP